MFILIGSLTILFEELIFRTLPLGLIAHFSSGKPRRALLAIRIIATSVIFGWLHGGLIHVFIQGVSGAGLAIVFLKCGDLTRHYARGTGYAYLVHMSFNATLLIPYFIYV